MEEEEGGTEKPFLKGDSCALMNRKYRNSQRNFGVENIRFFQTKYSMDKTPTAVFVILSDSI